MIDISTGFAVLISLDLAVLGISVVNARQVGTDKTARETARKALRIARSNRRRGEVARGD